MSFCISALVAARLILTENYLYLNLQNMPAYDKG